MLAKKGILFASTRLHSLVTRLFCYLGKNPLDDVKLLDLYSIKKFNATNVNKASLSVPPSGLQTRVNWEGGPNLVTELSLSVLLAVGAKERDLGSWELGEPLAHLARRQTLKPGSQGLEYNQIQSKIIQTVLISPEILRF